MDRKKQIGGLLLAAAVIVGGFPAGSRQTVTQAQKLAMQGNTAETVQVVSTGALTLSDATVDERAYYENIIYKQNNKKWHMKPGYAYEDRVYQDEDTIEIYVSTAYANGKKNKEGKGILDINPYGVSKGTVLDNTGNATYKASKNILDPDAPRPVNAGMSTQTAKHIYMVNDLAGTTDAVVWQYRNGQGIGNKGNLEKRSV